MTIETIDEMAPVMGADGEFHAQDEAVDLSGTKLEAWVALGFFWVLGITVFYQFFTRYVMNDSAAWTEEIARYLLIAVVFTGATIGVIKNNHIQVDFFYRLLPRYITRPMSTTVDIVRIVFLGYCAWLTYALMQKIGSQRMAIVDWPIGILYGFVCFGFVLMTWRALEVAWNNWNRGCSVLEKPELADEMK